MHNVTAVLLMNLTRSLPLHGWGKRRGRSKFWRGRPWLGHTCKVDTRRVGWTDLLTLIDCDVSEKGGSTVLHWQGGSTMQGDWTLCQIWGSELGGSHYTRDALNTMSYGNCAQRDVHLIFPSLRVWTARAPVSVKTAVPASGHVIRKNRTPNPKSAWCFWCFEQKMENPMNTKPVHILFASQHSPGKVNRNCTGRKARQREPWWTCGMRPWCVVSIRFRFGLRGLDPVHWQVWL